MYRVSHVFRQLKNNAQPKSILQMPQNVSQVKLRMETISLSKLVLSHDRQILRIFEIPKNCHRVLYLFCSKELSVNRWNVNICRAL